MSQHTLVCPHCSASHQVSTENGKVKCRSCGEWISVVTPVDIDLSVRPTTVRTGIGRPRKEGRAKTVYFGTTAVQEYLLERVANDLGKKDSKSFIRDLVRDVIKVHLWQQDVAAVMENAHFKVVVCRSRGVLSVQVWRQPDVSEDTPILSIGDGGVEAYHEIPPVLYRLAKRIEERWQGFAGVGFVTDDDIAEIANALGVAAPELRRAV